MAVLKIIAVLLLVAYANADIDALMTKFNTTIKGQCMPDAATTTTPATTTPATTTSATTAVSGRKKRDTAQPLCDTEETKVSEAKDVAEFHTSLLVYAECQSANCTSLSSAVDALLKESGATAVTVCGTLLGLIFIISYFG